MKLIAAIDKYKVGDRVEVTKTPSSLYFLKGKIAQVTAKTKVDYTFEIPFGGMLVMSFNEMDNQIFKMKLTK